MKPLPKSCKTCRFAEWKRTGTGRIKNVSGRCKYVVVLPPLPTSVTGSYTGAPNLSINRRSMTPDGRDGTDCPVYEPIEVPA